MGHNVASGPILLLENSTLYLVKCHVKGGELKMEPRTGQAENREDHLGTPPR